MHPQRSAPRGLERESKGTLRCGMAEPFSRCSEFRSSSEDHLTWMMFIRDYIQLPAGPLGNTSPLCVPHPSLWPSVRPHISSLPIPLHHHPHFQTRLLLPQHCKEFPCRSSWQRPGLACYVYSGREMGVEVAVLELLSD